MPVKGGNTVRKYLTAAVVGGLLLLGTAQAHATEAPFVAYDTAAGGAQTQSTVSTVTADTVTLVQDGRVTAAAGTSAETSNLGIEVEAGDTITVNYALTDGADFASGAVRLFIYYSPNADTWATAPDQVAVADALTGTLSITATGGTIGTAGVVYDTSNPSQGKATFTGLTVAGEPVPFLPKVPDPDPDPDPGDDDGDDTDKDDDSDTDKDGDPVAVPTSVPAGLDSTPTGGTIPAGVAVAALVTFALAGILLLRRFTTQ
jgi:hypothetical protein